MFQVTLTSYGQSQISSIVIIDGVILLYDYIANIASLVTISSYTVTLDEEACGNLKGVVGNVRIQDLSSTQYQAKTILFYKKDGNDKKILGGYSQETPIVQKTSTSLSLFISLDFSAFTNGFLFSSIQAGYPVAANNSDGLVHIENPNIVSDDSYSVYSKSQVDNLFSTFLSGYVKLNSATMQNITSSLKITTNNDPISGNREYKIDGVAISAKTSVELYAYDNTETNYTRVWFEPEITGDLSVLLGVSSNIEDCFIIAKTASDKWDTHGNGVASYRAISGASLSDGRLVTVDYVTSIIPTTTSQLTNNSGFITSSDLPTNHVTTDTVQTITANKTISNSAYLYFGSSYAYVYGNSYGDTHFCNGEANSAFSSRFTLSAQNLYFQLQESGQSAIRPVNIQGLGSGSSRIMIKTDYIFLEDDTSINFEYSSSTYGSLKKTTHTETVSGSDITVPDVCMDLSGRSDGKYSRFVLMFDWLQVAYFDKKGLTLMSGEYITTPTLYATYVGSVSNPSTGIYSNSFVVPNGTSSQFLKADGTVDSTTYATISDIPTNYVTTNTVQEITGVKTFRGSSLIKLLSSSSYQNSFVTLGSDSFSNNTKSGMQVSFSVNNTEKAYYKTYIETDSSYTLTNWVTEPSVTSKWSIGTSVKSLKEVYADTFLGGFAGNIPYGVANETSSGRWSVTVSPSPSIVLKTGNIIAVKFPTTNTFNQGLTMISVNGSSNKQIALYGTTNVGSTLARSWMDGSVVLMMYDGTYWQILNANPSYVSELTTTMSTGSETVYTKTGTISSDVPTNNDMGYKVNDSNISFDLKTLVACIISGGGLYSTDVGSVCLVAVNRGTNGVSIQQGSYFAGSCLTRLKFRTNVNSESGWSSLSEFTIYSNVSSWGSLSGTWKILNQMNDGSSSITPDPVGIALAVRVA